MVRRWFPLLGPGIAAAALAILLACGYGRFIGPMFGIWDASDLAIGVLVGIVLVCLALASARGEQNPIKRTTPGGPIGPLASGGFAGPGSDPQTYYFPATSPIEARPHETGDNRWFWWAVPSGLLALALIVERAT